MGPNETAPRGDQPNEAAIGAAQERLGSLTADELFELGLDKVAEVEAGAETDASEKRVTALVGLTLVLAAHYRRQQEEAATREASWRSMPSPSQGSA